MPARLALVLLVTVACSSSGPANQEAVNLSGVVTNIDLVHLTITLSSQPGESPSDMVVHYNTLTIVDRQYVPGSQHVDQLQFGDNVVVHGRRDLDTEEITADRIVVITQPVKPVQHESALVTWRSSSRCRRGCDRSAC